MNIVHVIYSFDKINYGVWNAALFGSSYLEDQYQVNTVVVVCQPETKDHFPYIGAVIWAGRRPSVNTVVDQLKVLKVQLDNTIVVSHGCWLEPTRLGAKLKKAGFTWLYVPHGMLEPWSIKNNKWKKVLYYLIIERRLIKAADAIKAVSKVERLNLEVRLKRKVVVVENGVIMPLWEEKPKGTLNFLFMARLHYKKGLVPLVNAWQLVMKDADAKLLIAGPDEGELSKIESYLSGNVQYLGAVYGADKVDLLKRAHYYLLPSYSEGFPTSVVEAMSYGLIPLISTGCNFPEVFEQRLGYQVEPEGESLAMQLSQLRGRPFDRDLSRRNHEYIRDHFSEVVIGERLFSLYSSLKPVAHQTPELL